MTEAEVERLMAAARSNRCGHRDATMALMAYRHGLRAAEVVDFIEHSTGSHTAIAPGSCPIHRTMFVSWNAD